MAEKTEKPRVSMHPLLWLAAFFAVGIAAGRLFPLDIRAVSAVCIITAVAGALFSRKAYATVFVCAAFTALGALTVLQTSTVSADRVRRIYDEGRIASGDPIEVEGTLRSGPEPAFGGYILKLRTEALFVGGQRQAASGTVRLFVSTGSVEAADDFARLGLRYDSRLRVACRLVREDRFQNPGVMPRKQGLDQQDIDAVATVKSPLLIEKISEDEITFLAPIFELRQNLIEDFRGNFSVPTAGVLIASLLGDRNFLDKETADLFREGGTFHILVISGLHITFIGGLIVLAVGIFTRKRIWKFVIPVTFLWSYTIAVGAEVPVVRASLMFTVLLFSRVIYRRGSLLNTLGLCGLLLLAWRPLDLFNPSFQLTFVSVAAIVACAFPLIEKLREIGNWMPTANRPFPPNVPKWMRRFCETLYWSDDTWRIEAGRQIWSANIFKSPYLKRIGSGGFRTAVVFVFEGVLVSLIVQIWLLPLVIWYFHRISVASIILNLWTGIFIALESFAAVFTVLLSRISSWLAFPFVRITELFNALLLWAPQVLADNEWASYRSPVYSGRPEAAYLAYFLPLVMLAAFLYRWEVFSLRRTPPRLRLAAISSGAIAAVLVGILAFHPFSAPVADGRLTIDFLDVGQGDAALVTFPDGKTMLIDGGGRLNFRDGDEDTFEPDTPRIGEAVVSEFLWEKGYSRVDYLVATHADVDHIQGLSDVAANFDVGAAYVGQMPPGDREFNKFAATANSRRIPIEMVSSGDVFEEDGVRIEVLNPNKPSSPTAETDNNRSVVLRLAFGDRRFLLTGDIEAGAEMRLLATPELLQSDVIKVSHHGSRTASTQEFANAVKPAYAVISVGNRSIFGHPHREVLGRWEKSGAAILKTGGKGTITISTDGKDLLVATLK